ncbi:c-type cytochrome [Pelagicoccus albus]|uniref:C-type cytochrome n=1 Tax=Pelagicoccus albus TaxID=415222 RepID=A0A7X1E8Z0_9BACT|nr:c-type cytochrome [Pelagicoccus albus]MBC2607265.1 c-type cytochrome [Pelagicoccus albus]
MKTTLATILVLSSFSTVSHAGEKEALIATGKTKFEQVCIACHKYERTEQMIAPPAFAIQTHYAQQFGENEAAFRKAIVDWAKHPDADKTLMPGAITKFNLMPPLPLPDEDLDAIAAYIFSTEFTEKCDMKGMEGMQNGMGKKAGQRMKAGNAN